MAAYQLHWTGQCIVRLPDGAQVPLDPRNGDYAAFLTWRAAGNTALPADPAPPADPQATADVSDRDAFLAQVDAAITAITANGWDGISVTVRKNTMLGVLRALRVAARRMG